MFELSRLNDSLTERLHKSERKCEALQEDVTTLRNRLDVERERRNDLEQYGRRENLRFVKLGPDSSSETTTQCEDKVLAIINEKLKLGHITKQHISVAHRVGQFLQGIPAPGHRAVRIKATQNGRTYQARRNLKGSGIAIVEDLTPSKQKMAGLGQQTQGSQEHLDQGWQDLRSTGRQEGRLRSRRGTCPNCPEN